MPRLCGVAALAVMVGFGPAVQAAPGRETGNENATALMRQWAEDLAYTYLEGWSSGNAQALADVKGLYGPRVNFYGKFIDRQVLFSQKRSFGQRWPVRRYEHRPGTMHIQCEARTQACLVRSIIDWRAANPARGSVSRGASTFELGIGFAGPRPVVLFERGRVLGGGRRTAGVY
jgi:hypothetical protein